MSTERGVTCPHCGASTPLPPDLRAPSFTCAFCGEALETAAFAGHAAVSADALGAYLLTGPASTRPVEEFIRAAPTFQGSSRETRDAQCRRCRAPVKVPMDVTVRTFSCGACGVEQRINEYISDQARFEADMARQVAGNAELKRIRAQGVDCPKCGGHNDVPAQASVQFPCHFCGAVVLLSDHADETAVARHRLAEQLSVMHGDVMAQHEAQKRREVQIISAVLGVLVLLLVLLILFV